MNNLKYKLLYYTFGAISILPWRVLYILSDLFYVIIRLVGYRKDVIIENLRYSFPGKSEKELKKIRNRFYRHFCDLFVEVIKFQTLSKKDKIKHMTFENIEYVDKIFDEGRDILVALGHYGNWEWIGVANYVTKHLGGAIYKPLKSKLFDKYIYSLRTNTGGVVYPMNTVFRDLLRLKQQGRHYMIGVITDQTPGPGSIQHYTCFLNQKTPVHLGLEKMAVKFNDVIVFSKIEKVKRGYYKVTFIPLFENAKETKEFEITDTVMRYIEEEIKEKPEYWLWSHKRWKHVKDRSCESMNKDDEKQN